MPRGGEEPDRIGSVLGSYRVVEVLGKGGMGYVYRAEHVKLGREVALKLLRSDYAKRRDAVARFIQEARLVNRIRHRNIVDVPDIVELDDGTTFIVMEFLRGTSLGRWARSGIDLPRALAVLVQICDGLAAAHQVGVVHRDLKPDNVIVVPTSDGAELVKLLDFGVAKLVNRDDEDVGFQTAAGSVIGTPAYMSPEQAGGMAVDARSDIYSLGAIMYELFCGQPMFRGRSFGEYVRKHLTEMPIPPRSTAGGHAIDPRLEMLIMRCLEKDPNVRFGHILELRDALLGLLGAMDTHPPGLAGLTASAVRPPPNLAPTQAMALPLPPMMATILPAQPMIPPAQTPMHGSGSGLSHHPSQVYSYANYSQVMGPPTHAGPVAPWWVWFVGGAIAVGLGIGAAVWYASRSNTQPVAAPTPATEPVKQPVAEPIENPERPPIFAVKFDSLPSGGVYADGESAELCQTPCEHNIQTKGASKRTFIVKASGYKDGSIIVDLDGTQHEFKLTLEQQQTINETVADKTDDDPPDRPTAKKKKGKKGKKNVVDSDDKNEDNKTTKTEDPKPKNDDGLIDPTDGKVIKKKPPDTSIDPTTTRNPFRKRP